jgi:RimJ/RimL family protein N-acetyltransferase
MTTANVAATDTEVVITPTTLGDLRPLLELFQRSSPESRRQRFHGAVAQFPRRYLYAVTCGENGVVARVARDLTADRSGGCIVARGTAMPERAGQVEIAVWVDESRRHRGIATQLLDAVLVQAATAGATTAIAYLEPGNTGAVALARRLAHRLGRPPPIGSVARFDLTTLRSSR